MSFHIKKDKKPKKVQENNKTIENIHDEKMKYFTNLQKVTLPRLKNKLKDKNCKTKGDIITRIGKIENREEEYDYILKTNRILLEYFEINTSENIIDFENLGTKNIMTKKQELTEKYYEILEIDYHKSIPVVTHTRCNLCDNEMIATSEKYFTCFKCGNVDNEKLLDGYSYEERCNNKQTFVFDYKRINYFTEWLTKIQANESAEIPDELIEELKDELFKRNIKDTSKLTNYKLKKILKEIDQSKYYEHIPLLICKLCNFKAFTIPDEITIELKNMFLLSEQAFEVLKGKRKNFLSYPYILYKLCEILDLPEYLEHFLLLKSREKLMKSDVLWKKIVEHIYDYTRDSKWKFIPSC
jgi:hypothetical protein